MSKLSNVTLYLIANSFPFGTWEPYLENEISYLNDFKKVRIFSLSVREDQINNKRKVEDNITVSPILFRKKGFYFIYAIRALLDKYLYKEILHLLREHQFNLKRLVDNFVYFSRSHYESKEIIKIIKDDIQNQDSEFLIYSYRFAYQTYVGYLVSKKVKNVRTIARAHGSDLYAEVTRNSYIPNRLETIKHLDKVYLISQFGFNYLKSRFPLYSEKYVLNRLGTNDCGIQETHINDTAINIITCSSLVPLKQLNLLIIALSFIESDRIYWSHYGEGPLEEELKKLACDLLGDKENISYKFNGFVSNQDLMKIYEAGNHHLFVNVSSSEGVPVSIMEAMSFGVPCIATDVGGNPEIVEDGVNGYLLPAKFDANQLSDLISQFCTMNDSNYQNLRKSARLKWEMKYNADVNYKKFVSSIVSLYQDKSN